MIYRCVGIKNCATHTSLRMASGAGGIWRKDRNSAEGRTRSVAKSTERSRLNILSMVPLYRCLIASLSAFFFSLKRLKQ